MGIEQQPIILVAVEDAHNFRQDSVTIVSDSQSAISGSYSKIPNNRHPLVIEILEAVQRSNKRHDLCWVFSHVGITANERVDQAAKQAIGLPGVKNIYLPRSYYKTLVR